MLSSAGVPVPQLHFHSNVSSFNISSYRDAGAGAPTQERLLIEINQVQANRPPAFVYNRVVTGLLDNAVTTAQLERIDKVFFVKKPTVRGEEEKCSICLLEFLDRELINMLACSHLFHVLCLRNWLVRTPKCPVCKVAIQLT